MTYSPAFLTAVAKTLEHEGGWVNDPKDPGGATNYGISLRWLRETGDVKLGDVDGDGDIDAADIRALSRDRAIAAYHKHFWSREFDMMPVPVAVKLFDACVNMGPVQAIKLFQRALNRLPDAERYGPLVADGVLGPNTRARAEALDVAGVLTAYRAELAAFYERLVVSRPALAKFRKGWLRRAAS